MTSDNELESMLNDVSHRLTTVEFDVKVLREMVESLEDKFNRLVILMRKNLPIK